jgi:hypothetical protein
VIAGAAGYLAFNCRNTMRLAPTGQLLETSAAISVPASPGTLHSDLSELEYKKPAAKGDGQTKLNNIDCLGATRQIVNRRNQYSTSCVADLHMNFLLSSK